MRGCGVGVGAVFASSAFAGIELTDCKGANGGLSLIRVAKINAATLYSVSFATKS